MARRLALAAIVALAISASAADAATCPSLPYTLLNGTVASATQVMGNFTALLNCVNTSVAPLASPALTGVPTAPTAAAGTNTTQLATTAFARTAATGNGANPTATAGPTAVVGTATTFMRSDGAPAIQLASSSIFGLAKVDNTTITAASGIISAAATTVFGVTCTPASSCSGSTATNSLSGDVALGNGTFVDGPTAAQGTSGTWYATGTVTISDSAAASDIACKLWDGTTVISSGEGKVTTIGKWTTISLSGRLASPAANIRISCAANTATASFNNNASGSGKDSTITVLRIG